MFADLWPTLGEALRGLPCHQSADPPFRLPLPLPHSSALPHFSLSASTFVYLYFSLRQYFISVFFVQGFFQVNSENLMHAARAHSTEMAPRVSSSQGHEYEEGQEKGLTLLAAEVTEVGSAFIFIKLPQGEHLAHVLKQNKSTHTQNV